MKKIIIACLGLCALTANAADINVNLGGMRVETPDATITFGSRDQRGYYWDGRDWRDERYWREHQGQRGEKYYTGHGAHRRDRDHHDRDHDHGRHCPPGQAKKGHC